MPLPATLLLHAQYGNEALATMVANHPQIPWKRFWCPLGQPINCGEAGREFLADPEGDFGRIWSPNTFELEQILDRSCLILLGEPGMGKTTAIELARQTFATRTGDEPDLLWLTFRDIPSEGVFHRRTVESPKWQAWVSGNSKLSLVIDGTDEGLIRVPGFISYLVSELRGTPLARLQLIIVCRTAEWSLVESSQLIGLWGRSDAASVFELCPLRQTDAHLASKTWGIDADKFMSAVFAQNIAGLAARPTTLFFLLREFAANGVFPRTHFDLYREGCKRLCEEHDPARIAAFRFQPTQAQQFSTAEINEMAARIAALLLVGGKSAIHVGHRDNAEPGDLTMDEIAQSHHDMLLVQIAVSTALFSARSQERLAFAHQTFAECLAAQALQNLPMAQVRSLLCESDGTVEHVVPQLAETAAWLAAAKPDFFQFLTETEPEVLLRSDISQAQAQHKVELVMGLLDRVKRAEAFDDRDLGRFYSSLKHPALAKQLWEYIRNPALNVVVRRMAIEIAGDCKLEELITDLLSLLRTETNSTIRDYVARSLEKMTPPHRAVELIPLAKGEIGPDPDDTIKGCVLHLLVPSVWSVSDALPFLTPPKAWVIGAYHFALSQHIPEHIKFEDLTLLLPKLIEWQDCFDSLNAYQAISEKVLIGAVRNMQVPEIAELTVQVWRAKARKFLHFAGERESEFKKLLDQDDSLRLRLVECILNSGETTVEDVHHLGYGGHGGIPLIRPNDLEWLLKVIESARKERRNVWAQAVAALARPEAAASCWDLLLAKVAATPELKERFSWLRAYRLDEPEALRQKALWLEDKQRHEEWEGKRRNAPSPEARIERDLREINAGRASWWVGLSQDLTLKPGDTRYTSLGQGITETPGWQRSDEERRKQIAEAARQFLLQCDGGSGNGGRTNYTEAGYSAIWLLRDRIRGEADLRVAIAEKWIDAITGSFNNGEKEHQEMVALAYELNPDRCLRGFLREVLDDDRRSGHILALRGYRRCWDARLTQELINLITSGQLKATGIESSLSFLAEADPQAATGCVKLLLPPGIEKNNEQKERTKAVLCVAHAKLTVAVWDSAWPLIEADNEFGEHVLQKLAYGVEYSAKDVVSPPTSEHQLAEIYLLLQRVFPPEKDPSVTNGTQTSRQMIPRLKSDVISALTSRGTDAACRELLRLSEAIPKARLWLRWRHWEALRLKRRKGWQPLAPLAIRSLLDNPAARIIEDENDLLDVILESLERFQARLTRSSLPQAALLWNYEGSGNKRKNFRPKDEEDLSDMVAAWLMSDIGPKSHVVIGREVQPRRGKKTDIKVEAIPTGASGGRLITVIIEVKGCWHREVRTAIKTQLVEDYLNKNGWTHGIYLVGWYLCKRWSRPPKRLKSCLKSKTYKGACKEVETLASPYIRETGSAVVKSVCLDCRFPG